MTAVTGTFEISKLQETKLGRLVSLILLAMSAVVTVGCSTQPVTSTSDSKTAYESCVDMMSAYGRAYECNNATYTVTTTYPTYNQYNQQYGYTYINGKLTQRDDVEVMGDYLETLDQATKAELTAQWTTLASQANQASVAE